MSLWGYVLMSTGTCEGRKGTSHPLKLELQTVVQYQTWALDPEPGSSARAGCTPDYGALSLVHKCWSLAEEGLLLFLLHSWAACA